MKSSAKKVERASVDDLFSTEQERQQAGEERVVRVPLSQLHYFKGYPAMQTEVPFAGQPYRVKDDDPKMLETLDSVRQRGVRTPGLVRPDPDGGYEIICIFIVIYGRMIEIYRASRSAACNPQAVRGHFGNPALASR